jgi:diaminohydroxyphosphoribosylaminopyrimidine deaminase/5-amino-6-(5-phosphoribosylamino)uracil reductase
LRIPLTAQVLQGGAPTIVVTAPDADATKVQMLADLPDVEVLTVPVQDGNLNLVELMKILGERKIISVLVEGGSAVLGSFVDAKLADRVYAFHRPENRRWQSRSHAYWWPRPSFYGTGFCCGRRFAKKSGSRLSD